MKKKDPIPGTVVRVTSRDIKQGFRWDYQRCPMALAVNRKLHARCDVGGEDVALITVRGKCYNMPKRAFKFYTAFDRGQRVKPFSFRIGKEDK